MPKPIHRPASPRLPRSKRPRPVLRTRAGPAKSGRPVGCGIAGRSAAEAGSETEAGRSRAIREKPEQNQPPRCSHASGQPAVRRGERPAAQRRVQTAIPQMRNTRRTMPDTSCRRSRKAHAARISSLSYTAGPKAQKKEPAHRKILRRHKPLFLYLSPALAVALRTKTLLRQVGALSASLRFQRPLGKVTKAACGGRPAFPSTEGMLQFVNVGF